MAAAAGGDEAEADGHLDRNLRGGRKTVQGRWQYLPITDHRHHHRSPITDHVTDHWSLINDRWSLVTDH
jgi:hypothetical protein